MLRLPWRCMGPGAGCLHCSNNCAEGSGQKQGRLLLVTTARLAALVRPESRPADQPAHGPVMMSKPVPPGRLALMARSEWLGGKRKPALPFALEARTLLGMDMRPKLVGTEGPEHGAMP